VLPHLVVPRHHDVSSEEAVTRRRYGNLAAAAVCGPQDLAALLLVPSVKARTVRALPQVAEVVHGAPFWFSDPARFSIAHGGRDRHPYLGAAERVRSHHRCAETAVQKAKLGHSELAAVKRLDQQAPRLERDASGPSVEALFAVARVWRTECVW
jgi:hypothetical protein